MWVDHWGGGGGKGYVAPSPSQIIWGAAPPPLALLFLRLYNHSKHKHKREYSWVLIKFSSVTAYETILIYVVLIYLEGLFQVHTEELAKCRFGTYELTFKDQIRYNHENRLTLSYKLFSVPLICFG